MSPTPSADAPDLSADPAPNEDLRDQLFRYARDLDDLLDQHRKLQLRHQALLQLHGGAPTRHDLLLDFIGQGSLPLAVTDPNGFILRADRAARALLQGSGRRAVATSLAECVAPADRAEMEQLLTRLAASASFEAVVVTRLRFVDPAGPGGSRLCTVLAVPVRSAVHSAIHWVLQPTPESAADRPPGPRDLLPLDSRAHGVLVIDPQATILAANRTFCAISESDPASLIGQPARLLGWGRQIADFHDAFWKRLQAYGSWTGELLNRRRSGRIYPEWKSVRAVQDMDGRLMGYLVVVRDMSDEDLGVESPSGLAFFDGLTGLPNRRLLTDRIAQAARAAARGGPGHCVVLIDLDRFRHTNEQLGHDFGDQVLQQVAARLSRSARGGDTVARIGSDEFVVLLSDTATVEAAALASEKILTELSAPVEIGDHRLLLGASVGAALGPGEGADAEQLLQRADAAMRRARHAGGNRIVFHGDRDGDALPRPPTLGLDIWGATGRGEIRLVYQPQVTVDRPHRLRGCEALLRWCHPVHGEIRPDHFIPVAEKNGAIVELGRWALTTACAQMRAWQELGLGRFVVSVNVSYRQLLDPGFATDVRRTLERTGLEPGLLELEVTESRSSLLEGLALEHLKSLRALGVQVAIDDFGIGYSSLQRLFAMPADSLKIDRLFVRDLDTSVEARALSRCVIGVGTAMGMQVIAEGIEHQGQLDVLAGQGCHLMQGYLPGAPMEAQSLVEWARHQGVQPTAPPTSA